MTISLHGRRRQNGCVYVTGGIIGPYRFIVEMGFDERLKNNTETVYVGMYLFVNCCCLDLSITANYIDHERKRIDNENVKRSTS